MSQVQKFEIKASLKIQKPVHEVFESIVDPSRMSNYLISESTALTKDGKIITWQFAESNMQFPVRISKEGKDKYISFSWYGAEECIETRVEILLKPMGNETFVPITAKSRDNDKKDIKWLTRNTEGSANLLASLKAYPEYGINLRKCAFDISQMPTKEVVV